MKNLITLSDFNNLNKRINALSTDMWELKSQNEYH